MRKFADHLERTAYHEAGHAIMVRLAGWTVRTVHIDEHDGGITSYMESVPRDHFRRLFIMLAGMEAEEMVLVAGEYLTFQCNKDVDCIAQILTDMDETGLKFGSAEGARRAWSDIKEIVQTLLKANWNDVEKLADELMARVGEKITGDEIDALLGPAVAIEMKEELALALAAREGGTGCRPRGCQGDRGSTDALAASKTKEK